MINNGVNIIMMFSSTAFCSTCWGRQRNLGLHDVILLYLIIIGQLLLIKLQKNNKEKLIKN